MQYQIITHLYPYASIVVIEVLLQGVDATIAFIFNMATKDESVIAK